MRAFLTDYDKREKFEAQGQCVLTVETKEAESVNIELYNSVENYSTIHIRPDKNGTIIVLSNGDEIFIRTNGGIHYMPKSKAVQIFGSVETRSSPSR